MDNPMAFNVGDASPGTMEHMSPVFPKPSPKVTGLNDVYIGHIPMDIDVSQLYNFFSQFGEVERIFDGHKSSSGGMKWAFVSYYRPEDANKYISGK
jgi:RNA recognition motif-containing protein